MNSSEPRLSFNRACFCGIYVGQKQYAVTTISLRLAAARRVTFEAADSGLLSPGTAAATTRLSIPYVFLRKMLHRIKKLLWNQSPSADEDHIIWR